MAEVIAFGRAKRELSEASVSMFVNTGLQQAKFVQQHRTAQPTDRIEFHVMDLVRRTQFGASVI